jgi:ParB/RepB/Spo0J family partition protein
MAKRKTGGLGSGLLGQGVGSDVETVIRNRAPGAAGETLRTVDPGQLERSPWQPRTVQDGEALEELAASIREHGILEPLLARKRNGGALELLAGERRLEAAKLAGLERVPVRVLEVNDSQAAAIALTENLQRENLTAWEEAQGVASLRDVLEEAGERPTLDRLAEVVGWSSGKVSERLQIAEALAPSELEARGVDLHAVKKLPKAALYGASRLSGFAQRVEALNRYLRTDAPASEVTKEATKKEARKGGRPVKPFTLRTPATGRVSFQLRRPVEKLEPAEAREALERLEPVLEALRKRAGS